MTNDLRLEQLKAAQDRAFQKKQEAYQVQQRSWDNLSGIKTRMDQAFEAKQRAFQDQERAWQEYQSVRNRNSSRIDYLNSAQESAYQNMKNAFDRASSAHSSRDGASAKAYSMEGHAYKAEAQGHVSERRRLVDECRTAKYRHDPYKQTFDNAKITFDNIKSEFVRAKAVHERANAEFKQTKADFDTAAKAFQSRLSELKSENSKKKENRRALAVKAGVPYRYLNDVYVSEDMDGNVNIYFGGAGEPAGFGHGHYAMDRNGNVTYKRDPFDPHGSQNFTEEKSEYLAYDRHMRADKLPIMSGRSNGVIYLHGEKAGQSVHFTQVYDDGYHVSWDANPDGTIEKIHWTNDDSSIPPGDPAKHLPPSDARNI